MVERGVRAEKRGLAIAIAAIAAALYLILAGRFLPLQNVWIDESTQLLGSGLPFGRMLAWLGGHFEPLGVPGDRMPPVSYLVDFVCGRTVCGSVVAYRWLHLLIAAAGVAGLVLLAGQRYGWVAGIVSGAFLALAPQMITTGVEVRAYPIFFAVTVLQLWLLFRLIEGAALSPRRLAAFAVAGILAIYTHFFGVISSSALFTGLIAARARSGRDLVWMLGAWLLVLLSAAGIMPFVMGATAISQGVENAGRPGPMGIALYLSRIIGHSSMMLHPWLFVLVCVGLGLLLLLASWRYMRPVIAAPAAIADPAVAVLIALAAGLGVSILAAFVVHGFNPMKPSYSIWAIPLVALMAGATCASIGRLRWLALLAAALMIVAMVPETAVFETHADWFVHGPEQAIREEVGDPPAKTAVVYADDDWAYPYFPLIYRFRGALGQYRLDPHGALHAIGPGGDPQGTVVDPSALRRYDRLLLVSMAMRSYRDLQAYQDGAGDPADVQPLSGDLLGPKAGAWNSVKVIIRPGVYWLRMTRLQRNDAP